MIVSAFHHTFRDERLYTYDRAANPDRLNCWQLTPDGLSWVSDHSYAISFEAKGVACLLPNNSGFAIVETSLDYQRNRLYFVDARNRLKPHDPLPEKLRRLPLVPDQAFPSDDVVKVIYVDLSCQPYDYQVDYDPADLHVIRWDFWK